MDPTQLSCGRIAFDLVGSLTDDANVPRHVAAIRNTTIERWAVHGSPCLARTQDVAERRASATARPQGRYDGHGQPEWQTVPLGSPA